MMQIVCSLRSSVRQDFRRRVVQNIMVGKQNTLRFPIGDSRLGVWKDMWEDIISLPLLWRMQLPTMLPPRRR